VKGSSAHLEDVLAVIGSHLELKPGLKAPSGSSRKRWSSIFSFLLPYFQIPLSHMYLENGRPSVRAFY
jgi:hypothetical protein